MYHMPYWHEHEVAYQKENGMTAPDSSISSLSMRQRFAVISGLAKNCFHVMLRFFAFVSSAIATLQFGSLRASLRGFRISTENS